jgi:phospholipid/cholesterol/gamma-HCH transport system permease protein
MRFLQHLGVLVFAAFAAVGEVSMVGVRAFYWLPRRPFRFRHFVKQFDFVGVQSLGIIVLAGSFTGAVIALQSSYALRLFQANTMVGPMVLLALTREMGPVLAGLLVTGRVGSAMAAELGTMRVTEQIDALETLAVNPIQYLVVPRVVAAVLLVPGLSAVFSFVGGIGAYVVSTRLLDVPPAVFLNETLYYVDLDDFYIGLLKSAYFGLMIGLIACYKGLNVTGGAEGVGRATTESVVVSSIAILISDYFLTALLF